MSTRQSRHLLPILVGLVAGCGTLLVVGTLLTGPLPIARVASASVQNASPPGEIDLPAGQEPAAVRSEEPIEEPRSTATVPATATVPPVRTPTPAPLRPLATIASSTATPSAAPATATVAAPSPTATPARLVLPAARDAAVPILMYHYIRVNPDPTDAIGYGLSITPDLFAAHMGFLAERGYQAVPMRELDPYLGTGRLPTLKTTVLTFDDGYRDAYVEAWPVLKQHGFRATIYMITDLIENRRYLTAAQLRELNAAGIEIGSHTVTHSDLPSLSIDRARRELVESRAVLERLLGGPVTSFCYPSGRSSLAVRQAVRQAGYRSAVTVEPGLFRATEDAVAIPRVRVYGGMGLRQLARSLGEAPPDPARWAGFLDDRPNPRRG